jgi:hypothetical protein
VATPVPGFRDVGGYVKVARRDSFVSTIANLLSHSFNGLERGPDIKIPGWQDRAGEFEKVLTTVASRRGGIPC